LITHVDHLSFSFGSKPVLTDISFDIKGGEVLSVLAPNGGGKTTLFRCILGLTKNYTGTILMDNTDIRGMGARKLSKYAAYVPQSHYPAFNYNVLDMVLMGTAPLLKSTASPGHAEEDLARGALQRLGIEHLEKRSFIQLSGGERRLVLIARAIARSSPLLILDEPTADLDLGHQAMVLSHVDALRSMGLAVLMSTHDPAQAYACSDKIIALSQGRILACGTPDDAISEPVLKELYGVDTKIDKLPSGQIHISTLKGR
jgi:iron complex transport system ATP-binding protein